MNDMTQQEKFDLIVNEVNSLIPEEAKDECEVIVNEVVKDNDTRLHGIMIKYPGRNVFPTLYLEDLAEDLDNGVSVTDIGYNVLAMSLMRAPEPCMIDDFSYDGIKQNLRIFVVEEKRNKDRLSNTVHKSIDCGFALMACIVVEDGEGGVLRLPVTKDMAYANAYDIEELLARAMSNTMMEFEPRLSGLLDLSTSRDEPTYSFRNKNPMEEEFEFDDSDIMYVLSNQHYFHGATVLFYPDVKPRIAELIGENFYILPSSVHEIILVPESRSPKLNELRRMVLSANRDVVDPRDVLSDKVFLYEKCSGMMMAV
ncbi:MAG: hypothetical protein KBS68_00580 [Clostridiales bacterium]|nr:hypothetical protein [Candidatus Crickella merdequi]